MGAKRTSLVLNRQLLDEAMRLSGARSYSQAVALALEELVRRIKSRQIVSLAGSGLWQGDIAAMRRDRPHTARTKPRGRHGPR